MTTKQQPETGSQPAAEPVTRREAAFLGAGALRQTGNLFVLAASVIRLTFKRPFQTRELIEQFWFIASVTILPSALVSIPFGAVIALQVGSLAQEKAASLRDGEPATVASPALVPQLVPSPGMPERQAVQRHMDRVMTLLPTLPTTAQRAILAGLGGPGQQPGPAQAPAQGAAQPSDPERERAQAQARAEAWKLAREREAAQREAEQETAEQDRPGSWPPDWPGGSG